MKTTTPILALAATTGLALGQGPLAPPAGPAPTMKSLDQIEARTAIPASPAVPIAGPHFTISAPGSYYLTGNITVTSGDGIRISAASDVSIDLNGYTIATTLTGSAGGRAIFLQNAFTRLTVRNGFIRSGSVVPLAPATPTLTGFFTGIYSASTLSEALISGVHISGCTDSAIFVDGDSIVENCTVTNNGANGIVAAQSIVTHCIATSNGSNGISASSGSVSHCRAADNRDNGIVVGQGVVAHCVASGNDLDGVATDFQIKVTAGGQRIGCVPAVEAGSP